MERRHELVGRVERDLGDPRVALAGEDRVDASLRSKDDECSLGGIANEPAVPGRAFDLGEGRVRVELLEPQPGVAPGQACVCYAGTRLLGGGWIERAPLRWQAETARLSA